MDKQLKYFSLRLMTDYSWLEPIERRTKEIREETQRMREEIEKMKQESHNLPVPDNAPWLNLSQEEINQLRNQKHSLTEYGKQKFKEMTTGQLMDTEKFQEEFAKSQVFDADKFAEENSMVRNHRILERYNMFYNTECSGLSHGTPITPEFQQAMTLECMLDALRYENLNHEFDVVSTADINALIDGLYQQGKDYLERVRTFQEEAQK